MTEIDRCQNIIESCKISDELVCPLCGDLLTEAVMLPCCAISTCDICAKTSLSKSLEERAQMFCPLEECSSNDISIEDLIPNRRLRQKAISLICKFPELLQDKGTRVKLIARKKKKNIINKLNLSHETHNEHTINSQTTDNKANSDLYKSNDSEDRNIISPESPDLSPKLMNEDGKLISDSASEMKTQDDMIAESCNIDGKLYDVHHADQNHSSSKEQSVSMSVSYDLHKTEDVLSDAKNTTQAHLVLSKKQVDIEFDDSSFSEPPIPGEESSNNSAKSKVNSSKEDDGTRKKMKSSFGKDQTKDMNGKSLHNVSPVERSEFAQNPHRINIPSHYLDEAIDDPLAVFNKLMAAKDKEKGITNSLEHYGVPRHYRSSWSPVRSRAYYDYPSEHHVDSTYRTNSYRSSSRYERKSFNYSRCYNCDRTGHYAYECRERCSPRRYRYDYSRYYHERKSYEERIERDEIHSMKYKSEKRSPLSVSNNHPTNEQRKSASPNHSITAAEEENVPITPAVSDQESMSSPIKKDKKSRFKSKRTISPEKRKEVKKKSKKEVKEISTYLEVNAHVHERCTKKKDKKENTKNSRDYSSTSDQNVSYEEIEVEQEKQKKKKKSKRALELLEEELRDIITKRHSKQQKKVLEDKKKYRNVSDELEKNSKKNSQAKKCSSKSLKKKIKSKHSSQQKYESSSRKKEHKKESKQEKRKYDK